MVSKLGKVPALVTADGFKLYECIAIAVYSMCAWLMKSWLMLTLRYKVASQNKSTGLLGSNDREHAAILQHMSFFNSEIIVPLVEQYLPLAGIRPYDESAIANFEKMSEAAIAVVEDELNGKRFLVGDSVSLADYFCAGIISLGFQFFYGKDWRARHPNVVRWYAGVVELEAYEAVTDKVDWIDNPKFANRASA